MGRTTGYTLDAFNYIASQKEPVNAEELAAALQITRSQANSAFSYLQTLGYVKKHKRKADETLTRFSTKVAPDKALFGQPRKLPMTNPRGPNKRPKVSRNHAVHDLPAGNGEIIDVIARDVSVPNANEQVIALMLSSGRAISLTTGEAKSAYRTLRELFE